MALDYIIGGLQLVSAAVNVLALGAFWISPGLRTTANRFVINLLVANVIACLALTPALWLNGGLKTNLHIEQNGLLKQMHHNEHFGFESNGDLLSRSIRKSELLNHHQHHSRRNKVERDVREQQKLYDAEETFPIVTDLQESIESLVIERDENGNVHKFSEKQRIDIKTGNEKDEIEIVEEIAAEPVSITKNYNLEVEQIARIKHNRNTLASKAHTIFTENALVFDCTRFWGFDFAASIGK